MKNLKPVKFFLSAALLIGVASVNAATPAQEDESPRETAEREAQFASEQYDWKGDPNSEIATPGTSVVDTALDRPVAVNCHDCEVANQYSGPRSRTFEASGGPVENKGGGPTEAQQ